MSCFQPCASICKMFCAKLQGALCIYSVEFMVLTKVHTLYIYIYIYVYIQSITEPYTCIYIYIYARARVCVCVCVCVCSWVWLWALYAQTFSKNLRHPMKTETTVFFYNVFNYGYQNTRRQTHKTVVRTKY
jgi:hypothetical protein